MKTCCQISLLISALAFALMPLLALSQDTNVATTNVATTNSVSISNPVTTTESANVWALLNAMVTQIVNSPASLLVIIGLSILAYVFEVSTLLPTKAILPICTFGGAVSYWLFSSPTSVPPYFPYPYAVLVVNGLTCGFFAFIVHTSIVKWIVNKFQPGTMERKKEGEPPKP